MNRSTLKCFLAAVAVECVALVDARASAQEKPPAPTQEACDSAYTACFSEYGFLGLIVCPGQYAQCRSQVEGAASGNTNETVSKVTACLDAAATCRTDAGEDQEKVTACSQTQRACVTTALGVDTAATDKARACFETSQQCVEGADGNDAVGKCLTDLRACLAPPAEATTPG
jgi:hypothetical protein